MLTVSGNKYHLEDEKFSIEFLQKKGVYNDGEAHWHTFYEIYYLMKGERIYFINETVYTARSGDLVVINPHDVHRTTSSSTVPEFERVLVNFSESFLSPGLVREQLLLLPFQGGSRLLRFPVKEQTNIEHLFF